MGLEKKLIISELFWLVQTNIKAMNSVLFLGFNFNSNIP